MDIENPYRQGVGSSSHPPSRSFWQYFQFRLKHIVIFIMIVGITGLVTVHNHVGIDFANSYSPKIVQLENSIKAALRGSASNTFNSHSNIMPSESLSSSSSSSFSSTNNIKDNKKFRNDDDDHNNHAGKKDSIHEAETFTLTSTKHPTPAPTVAPTLHPTKHPTRHPTKHPTRQPTRQPTLKPTMKTLVTNERIPKTTPKNALVDPGEKIDYCKGNEDPFKKFTVEQFEVPKSAPIESRRQWEKAVKNMLTNAHKIPYGGKKLRDQLTKEVEKLEILRFELFCSYA